MDATSVPIITRGLKVKLHALSWPLLINLAGYMGVDVSRRTARILEGLPLPCSQRNNKGVDMKKILVKYDAGSNWEYVPVKQGKKIVVAVF